MKRKTLAAIGLAASLLLSAFGAIGASAAEEQYDANNPPIATTAEGQLRGYMDNGTYAFLGITYATADRFEEPQKVEPWEGVKNAQTYGTICPIPDQTSVGNDEMVWPHRYWIQNEQCMNLNVWTQSLDTEAKRPVLVFFHGGGYTNGSSIESASYEGRNLSEYGNAVVVTVNHRLNVLGFLDLSAYGGDFANTSNLGIKDLVASLEWIQENIANFGGDPDNVTIFGQSGGGGKVMTLMRTPAAEGLFDKAVCISGGGNGITTEAAQSIAPILLDKLGIYSNNIEALKTVDYHTLISAAADAATEAGAGWSPENDGEYILDDYCDWAKDIPFIAGSTFSEFNYNWMYDGPNKNEWTDEEITANLADKYGDLADDITTEFEKVFPGRTLADAYFYAGYGLGRLGVEDILNHRSEVADAPVYEYLFDYEAPVNGGILPFHCTDLSYLFHNVDIPVVSRATGADEAAHKVQDDTASMMIAFAETGDPSIDGVEWKPYTEEEKNIMHITENSECTVLGDEQLCTLIQQAAQQ